jgi:hypothetical protein
MSKRLLQKGCSFANVHFLQECIEDLPRQSAMAVETVAEIPTFRAIKQIKEYVLTYAGIGDRQFVRKAPLPPRRDSYMPQQPAPVPVNAAYPSQGYAPPRSEFYRSQDSYVPPQRPPYSAAPAPYPAQPPAPQQQQQRSQYNDRDSHGGNSSRERKHPASSHLCPLNPWS